jgi:hypothetical protein
MPRRGACFSICAVVRKLVASAPLPKLRTRMRSPAWRLERRDQEQRGEGGARVAELAEEGSHELTLAEAGRAGRVAVGAGVGGVQDGPVVVRDVRLAALEEGLQRGGDVR